MAEEYSPSNPNQPSRLRFRLLFLLAAGALLLFLGITGIRIVRAAGEIPARKADAIVIFGAAEYAGRPSPVYRARLDHGFELFKKGMAPVVITTVHPSAVLRAPRQHREQSLNDFLSDLKKVGDVIRRAG